MRGVWSPRFRDVPFKERQGDINVWGWRRPRRSRRLASVPAHLPPVAHRRDLRRLDSERYVLTREQAFRDVAANAPYDVVEILVNSATYGGGGIFGLYSTVAADSVWRHTSSCTSSAITVAGLADEYYTVGRRVSAGGAMRRAVGSRMRRRCSIRRPLKWEDLVTPGVGIPTPWPKEEFER